MVDTDGVDELTEAFDGQLRLLVTTATHMGDLGARMMADRNRAMRDEAERNSRELAARFEAERAAARAELAEVYRGEWWDRADVEAIANKYELARAWVGEEPEALRAELHMREELRTRYGLDVDHPGADPAAVQKAIDRRKQEQEREENEQRRAAADKAEAAELSAIANREDVRAADAARDLEQHPEVVDLNAAAVAEHTHEIASESARAQGDVAYDSAERRDATAAALGGRVNDARAVEARMRADVSQAKPATAAVATGSPSRSPKVRSKLNRSRTKERGGLER